MKIFTKFIGIKYLIHYRYCGISKTHWGSIFVVFIGSHPPQIYVIDENKSRKRKGFYLLKLKIDVFTKLHSNELYEINLFSKKGMIQNTVEVVPLFCLSRNTV